MEPLVPNSPPPAAARYHPPQPIADRIVRALCHHLRLLHRSDATFYVLGATGNVYTVTLSAAPSCTCPDRTVPCKHILFVLLRVLGLPPDDVCLLRRTLRPCQLGRILTAPTAPDALASARACERFHQLFSGEAGRRRPPEGGAVCPVCLEEVAGGGGAEVSCGTCGNAVHEECLAKWRRSRGRRAATCVVCRARWRPQQPYLNLAAYAGEDDDAADGGGVGLCDGR